MFLHRTAIVLACVLAGTSASHATNPLTTINGKGLFKEQLKGGQIILRLTHLAKNKEIWRNQYAAGTVVVTSHVTGRTGVVQTNGTFDLLDIESGKVIWSAKLEMPKVRARNHAVHLLGDAKLMFLAFHDDSAIKFVAGQTPQALFDKKSGLQSVPVHGRLFALTREKGKIRWYFNVANQNLLVAQIDTLPMVVLTTKYQHFKKLGFGRKQESVVCVQVIDKGNGKLMYDDDKLAAGLTLTGVKVDRVKRELRLTGNGNGLVATFR